MARDDYEVIVCKILVYLYKRMKGKLTKDDACYLCPTTRQLPISEEYLNAVLIDLNDRGMIRDMQVNKAWGGDVMCIDTSNAKITLDGVQYLRENATMRKIVETLSEAMPIWSLFSDL